MSGENKAKLKRWHRVIIRSTFVGIATLCFAVEAAQAAPVAVDVSFSGVEQTANWSQTISPASVLTTSIDSGIFFGAPFVGDPNPQTDPVSHRFGTTFASSSPISLTDDGMPIGGSGPPSPVTTQFTFDDLDWSMQDIQNLHVDFLNNTAIEGDWEKIALEIDIANGNPGTIQLDFFHTTQDISFWQSGNPTIGTDGSFAIPGTLRAAFSGTFETSRPLGSEFVHATGVQLIAVDEVFEMPFTLVGSITTTSLGGPPQNVLVELDGQSSFRLPFDTMIAFDGMFGPILSMNGSIDLASSFDMTLDYHLETVVPEPGSLSLLALGLMGFGLYFRCVAGKFTPRRKAPPS